MASGNIIITCPAELEIHNIPILFSSSVLYQMYITLTLFRADQIHHSIIRLPTVQLVDIQLFIDSNILTYIIKYSLLQNVISSNIV